MVGRGLVLGAEVQLCIVDVTVRCWTLFSWGATSKLLVLSKSKKNFIPHFRFASSLLYSYLIVANIIKQIYFFIKTHKCTFFFFSCMFFCVSSVDKSGIWLQKQNRRLEHTCFHLLRCPRKFWSAQQVCLLQSGNMHTQGVYFPIEAKSQISLLILKSTVTLFFIISCWLPWRYNEYTLTHGLILCRFVLLLGHFTIITETMASVNVFFPFWPGASRCWVAFP